MRTNKGSEIDECRNSPICDPRKTGRADQLCSECQNKIRRISKNKKRFRR